MSRDKLISCLLHRFASARCRVTRSPTPSSDVWACVWASISNDLLRNPSRNWSYHRLQCSLPGNVLCCPVHDPPDVRFSLPVLCERCAASWPGYLVTCPSHLAHLFFSVGVCCDSLFRLINFSTGQGNARNPFYALGSTFLLLMGAYLWSCFDFSLCLVSLFDHHDRCIRSSVIVIFVNLVTFKDAFKGMPSLKGCERMLRVATFIK